MLRRLRRNVLVFHLNTLWACPEVVNINYLKNAVSDNYTVSLSPNARLIYWRF
jgi:hypothetical protein